MAIDTKNDRLSIFLGQVVEIMLRIFNIYEIVSVKCLEKCIVIKHGMYQYFALNFFFNHIFHYGKKSTVFNTTDMHLFSINNLIN